MARFTDRDEYVEIAERLKADIDKAQKRIRIFSGEANCLAYNRPEVVAALEAAHKRGVLIQIIAGPVLSVCRSSPPKADVENLAYRQVLNLYFRSRRSRDKHYRVTDDQAASYQLYHSSMASPQSRVTKQLSESEVKPLIDDFDKLIEQRGKPGNGQIGYDVWLSKDPKQDFILLEREEIKKVEREAGKRGLDYNNLTKGEIKQLLKGVTMRRFDIIQFLLLVVGTISAAMAFGRATIADRIEVLVWAGLVLLSIVGAWIIDRYSQHISKRNNNTSAR